MSNNPQQPGLRPSGHLGAVPDENLPGHRPDVVQDKPTGPPPAPRRITKEHRFAFEFDPLFMPAAFAVGVTPWTASIVVDPDELRIRFGWWTVRTPLDNIERAEVTGPYNLLKVIGPPHLSLADRGVTFATNREAGVCVSFADPVAAIDPWGRVPHPAVTVTVDDPDGLARLLDPS